MNKELEGLSLDNPLADSVMNLVVGCIEHSIMMDNDVDTEGCIYGGGFPMIKAEWGDLSDEEFGVVTNSFFAFIGEVVDHIELYRQIVAENKAAAENDASEGPKTYRTAGNTLVKLVDTEFSHMLVENEEVNDES
tara:strand:+ start:486 stop:890 length:405 start_codon:yes stop_codon:yes gene_type:complete